MSNLEGRSYLNIEQALDVIKEIGFSEVKKRQVQRWAGEKKLPFFKFGKSLYIERSELLAAFNKMQNEASRKTR